MTIMLETAQLRLRPSAASDRDDLFALEQDAEVMRFLNGGRSTPLDGVDPDADFMMPRGGEAGIWVALAKATGAFVGWFSLHDHGDGTAELGYRLRRAAWGQGYGSEGARALVDAGFSQLGFVRIVANTMSVNRGSRRVMEKAGLVHVRTVHLDWPDPLPGSEEGDVEYAITREAWSEVSSRKAGS
ncbi:GNAT family N-acetyltransferase [Mesorhizobium sp. NPDC059025]|uniref:GNAT family N-acetyltransferase n=1 Tax=unclassified Mesorhizobium TaxID=325217 RepID=UPI003688F984